MKKYFLLIVTVLSFVFAPVVSASKLPEKTEHEKVKIYLFRGEGCGHCKDFLAYFIDKYSEYEDYFEIVTYESWTNDKNQKLMLAVKKAMDVEQDGSVPFIVVGDKYQNVGFGESTGQEIIDEALKLYQDSKYKDLVASIIKEEKMDNEPLSLLKAAEEEGIIKLDEDGNIKEGLNDGLVIGIIFGVVILGFVALVFFSRK